MRDPLLILGPGEGPIGGPAQVVEGPFVLVGEGPDGAISPCLATKKCVRCGEVKSIRDFYKKKSAKDGFQSYCKICSKELARAQERHGPQYIEHYLLNNPCVVCGQTETAWLDFHHRDPAKKFKSVSALVFYSLAVIQAEIDKCDVLCKYCHASVTWVTDGKPSKWAWTDLYLAEMEAREREYERSLL